MPSVINLNADTPVPPAGASNIIFQSDGGDPMNSISAFDPLFIGDSGTGGFSGNVPAPAAGDAAAGKVLSAAGVWAAPGANYFGELIAFTSTAGALTYTPTSILGIFRNGQLLLSVGPSPDYSITGTAVTLAVAASGTDVFYAIYSH